MLLYLIIFGKLQYELAFIKIDFVGSAEYVGIRQILRTGKSFYE